MKKSEKSTLISKTPAESHAGDILLLPIAILAFWTFAYQLVLIVRWPAKTITWCFLALAIAGFFLLAAFWNKTNATPAKGYRFHLSHLFLLILGLGYAMAVLFVRRPNQDDVVYFHRVLTQLLDLNQPIYLRQTSVDMDAAVLLSSNWSRHCCIFASVCPLLVHPEIWIESLGCNDRDPAGSGISVSR